MSKDKPDMVPVHQWFRRDEPELVAELAEAKARKEWLFPWLGSAGWKHHVPAVASAKPKEPLSTTTTMAEKEHMEETVRFMNEWSSKGYWVMHQRKTEAVENFSWTCSCDYIGEDRTGDQIFFNWWAS